MNTSRVVTIGSMSTLTFNPLAASDAGTYTCRAALGSAMNATSRTYTIAVRSKYIYYNYKLMPLIMSSHLHTDPTITSTVSIASNVATPMVGSMYFLNCTITGADRLTNPMVFYGWFKNGIYMEVSDQTMETLSFSSLTFSDAGRYSCQATVMSSLLLRGHATTTGFEDNTIIFTCELSYTVKKRIVNVTTL